MAGPEPSLFHAAPPCSQVPLPRGLALAKVGAHGGGGVLVQLADLAHEQQVLLLLLELGHRLLTALQLLLRPCQLLPQPLVLLHQAPHLSPQLLLLRLYGPQVA